MDCRLNAIKTKIEKAKPVHCKTFLNKAGNSRNGRSGKNMNSVGNKDKEPILIPAVNKAETAKPIKLSREKT